ncbi:hypothetical protein IQ268_15965 [Oculatella sp. LEGE 06141]|uniref:hypothetical protein n=1 Tax=Oculatella sp. LEGE 06141 TaxID=1828648 RepID=UPI001882FD32|nr:hypothetical protein [Oculatella sp. LEGE 06141]MBE9180067.1 hypothetical protein [Oculatella sp. LEGE 06141]
MQPCPAASNPAEANPIHCIEPGRYSATSSGGINWLFADQDYGYTLLKHRSDRASHLRAGVDLWRQPLSGVVVGRNDVF